MEKAKAGTEMLVEPLTKRERAILAHLLADKNNAEIAELETLAGETVKWYVKQIYAKLGVNKREEVAARARELGLLKTQAGGDEPAPRPKHNLPAQMTSFIGREKEISDLRGLLRKKETRLVTLTGSGGTGKTRLALQAAAGLVDAFADGVWLVELAPLADPGLVPQTVLSALGQVEQPGKTSTKQLEDYLRQKQLLLILDNCEHLVEACAALAMTLLQAAPRLTILASSREILGVAGEIPFRVPPMTMPDLDNLPALEEIARIDAVQLFVERARVAAPTFSLTGENASAVAQITQRLDGIPLALELAAARVQVLSVKQIALRLNDAFRLLTGGSRTALPRHQTLTALIDWSYDLLTEAERGLLRGLSAFAGGWTLEAAEQVCGGPGDVIDLLGRLANKSLIFTFQEENGEMRYRMLETVRQFAHARLVEAGEAQSVRLRHLNYYLHQAEILEPKLRSREQIPTLDYLEGELDNLRLALEWALQIDCVAELRLSASLQWFWHIRYHWAEGISWLEQGLEAEAIDRAGLPLTGPRALVRAYALSALGFHLGMRHQHATTSRMIPLEEALTLSRASGTEGRHILGWTLLWLGGGKKDEADNVQGRILGEEALSIFREDGDRFGLAESLQLIGLCEIDPTRKMHIHEEQLAIMKDFGDLEAIANAMNCIGITYCFDGDYTGAIAAFEVGRDHFRQTGNKIMVARNGFVLACASHLNGDLARASQFLEESLAAYEGLGFEDWIALCLFWKSVIAIAQGNYDRAAELCEDVENLARMTGNPIISADVLYLQARLARLSGDASAAWRFAGENIKNGPKLHPHKIMIYHEMGYLMLQNGDRVGADFLWRESLRELNHHIQGHIIIGFPLDGLAILAVHEGKMERAARLFGTLLWRGFLHTLSPVERAEREADFATLRSGLGEERFEQLREEGRALSFTQVLALAQEESQ